MFLLLVKLRETEFCVLKVAVSLTIQRFFRCSSDLFSGLVTCSMTQWLCHVLVSIVQCRPSDFVNVIVSIVQCSSDCDANDLFSALMNRLMLLSLVLSSVIAPVTYLVPNTLLQCSSDLFNAAVTYFLFSAPVTSDVFNALVICFVLQWLVRCSNDLLCVPVICSVYLFSAPVTFLVFQWFRQNFKDLFKVTSLRGQP